jgi:hypothetical protein
MLMEPKAISRAIRAKKKKVAKAEPELVDTDSRPDMSPMDFYDMEQKARIQDTLQTPPKINADEANLNTDPNNVGLTPEEMKRMARLRKYLGGLTTGR